MAQADIRVLYDMGGGAYVFMNWWLYGIAGTLAGLAGALGVGGGGILIVFLTVFTDTAQRAAQGINLLFFLPVAVLAIILYAKQKRLKWKPILFAAACGLGGVLLGVPLAGLLGDSLLRKIFAVVLILLGGKELLTKS